MFEGAFGGEREIAESLVAATPLILGGLAFAIAARAGMFNIGIEGQLIIAHRLSTMARADRILVLDQGRIAESGTHDELVTAGGVFYRFWLQQTMSGQAHAPPVPSYAGSP